MMRSTLIPVPGGLVGKTWFQRVEMLVDQHGVAIKTKRLVGMSTGLEDGSVWRDHHRFEPVEAGMTDRDGVDDQSSR